MFTGKTLGLIFELEMPLGDLEGKRAEFSYQKGNLRGESTLTVSRTYYHDCLDHLGDKLLVTV